MVCVTVHGVGQAVVAHINEDKQVFAADSLFQHGFSLAAVKAGRLELKQIVVLRIALKCGIIDIYIVYLAAKINQIIIHFISKLCGAL